MKAIDSHAHLDMDKPGHPTAEQLLENAFSSGLEAVVAIAGATTPGEFTKTLALAARHDRVFATAGIHPHGAHQADEKILDTLRHALAHPRVFAVGEIGLDYHYNFSLPDAQRRAFAAQLRIARELGLPVVIHTREADEDTLAILRDEGADRVGGVIHCFSAGPELADSALRLGFNISFSGIVTFPNAEEIREVARGIPDDRIMAETDTPFLSPVPYRGRPNEPQRVIHVIEKLAEIRHQPLEEIVDLTARNTCRVFKLPIPKDTSGA